jgi:hypothetical protein
MNPRRVTTFFMARLGSFVARVEDSRVEDGS